MLEVPSKSAIHDLNHENHQETTCLFGRAMLIKKFGWCMWLRMSVKNEQGYVHSANLPQPQKIIGCKLDPQQYPHKSHLRTKWVCLKIDKSQTPMVYHHFPTKKMLLRGASFSNKPNGIQLPWCQKVPLDLQGSPYNMLLMPRTDLVEPNLQKLRRVRLEPKPGWSGASAYAKSGFHHETWINMATQHDL
jgi:hypothetical protein